MSKPSTALDLARRLCVVHDKDGTVQICNTGKDSCPCDAAGDLDRIPAGAAAQIAALEEKVAKREQHMAKCEEGVRRVALEREVEALKAQLERARGWEPGGARDALLGEMADLRKQVEELKARCQTCANNAAADILKAEARCAELEEKLADAESLIDYAELSIDEAVESGWIPPSTALEDSEGRK